MSERALPERDSEAGRYVVRVRRLADLSQRDLAARSACPRARSVASSPGSSRRPWALMSGCLPWPGSGWPSSTRGQRGGAGPGRHGAGQPGATVPGPSRRGPPGRGAVRTVGLPALRPTRGAGLVPHGPRGTSWPRPHRTGTADRPPDRARRCAAASPHARAAAPVDAPPVADVECDCLDACFEELCVRRVPVPVRGAHPRPRRPAPSRRRGPRDGWPGWVDGSGDGPASAVPPRRQPPMRVRTA